MGCIGFFLMASAMLGATFLALAIARRYRASRDAAINESAGGGWRYRSQLPIDLGHPFNLFMTFDIGQISDVMEGNDEGFEVAHFDFWIRTGHRQGQKVPAAIVQLPVTAPALDYSAEGAAIPAVVGPQTAEVLRYMNGLHVRIVPSALMVWTVHLSSTTVQRTALQLAKAIVADAGAANPGQQPSIAANPPRPPNGRLLT